MSYHQQSEHLCFGVDRMTTLLESHLTGGLEMRVIMDRKWLE